MSNITDTNPCFENTSPESLYRCQISESDSLVGFTGDDFIELPQDHDFDSIDVDVKSLADMADIVKELHRRSGVVLNMTLVDPDVQSIQTLPVPTGWLVRALTRLLHGQSEKARHQEKRESSNFFAIAQEYCKLSKLQNPSEQDIDRLTAILELAQYDPELSCLINEADHLIAYELGLSEIPSTSISNENNLVCW